MYTTDQITIWIAIGAGLSSFLSPCVFPLIPTYITYITGASVNDLSSDSSMGFKLNVFLNSILFVLGFSLVFILFGVSASALGKLMLQNQIILRKISGIIIIFFGLNISGLIKYNLLQREKRFKFIPKGAGPLNSFLLGIFFSAGWTPCIGPILGSILALAGSSGNYIYGTYLLAAYSFGLAIPFLLSAFFIGFLLTFMRKYSFVLNYINIVSGILMVVVGVMIYTGFINKLAAIIS
ncbi:cytochrome c biogenesis CcdA family protein [Desulfonispora thiosulfatigenes]|uniref:cytochrome c biogenesis CcdA family protein n=1 Tax=Desulfonispora thiosulfatigenes TaxID=83661 RepID=UPI001FA914EB|nr:cytochrome c biogenesis protein CcdA [Desulfonispora thiosulfatigenes]